MVGRGHPLSRAPGALPLNPQPLKLWPALGAPELHQGHLEECPRPRKDGAGDGPACSQLPSGQGWDWRPQAPGGSQPTTPCVGPTGRPRSPDAFKGTLRSGPAGRCLAQVFRRCCSGCAVAGEIILTDRSGGVLVGHAGFPKKRAPVV